MTLYSVGPEVGSVNHSLGTEPLPWGAAHSPEPPGGHWCHWAPVPWGRHSRLERKPPNSHARRHRDGATDIELHRYTNSTGNSVSRVTPKKTLIFLLAQLWEKGAWLLMASDSPPRVMCVHAHPSHSNSSFLLSACCVPGGRDCICLIHCNHQRSTT